MKKTTNTMTLYDLMAEDYNLYIMKSKIGGYDVIMDGDDNYFEERGITEAAMDGFADVCEQFLRHYERVKSKRRLANVS